MKNDQNALGRILKGKIVIPEGGGDMFITADEYNPAEFIFIPFSSEAYLSFSILTNFKEETLLFPDENDIPKSRRCVVTDNALLKEDDFVWLEDAGSWAYYHD